MATASVLPVRPAPGLWRSPAAIRRTSRTRRFSRWLRHAASPIAPVRCWPQKENQNAVPILAAGETNPQRDNPLCSLEIALLPFESPSQKYRTPSSGIPTGRTARRHRRVHNQSPAHSYPRSFAAAFSNIQQDPHCPACPPRAPRSCLLRPLYKAPQTTPSDHPSAETPPPTLALSFGLSCSACLFASPKKLADILIQKFCIRGIGCRSRRVSPERWNRHQRPCFHEQGFVLCVLHRKIQIRRRRHIQKRHFDGTERLLHISAKTRGSSHVVLFPGPHLQNQIVGVRTGNKIGLQVIHKTLERRPRFRSLAPQLLPPPLLRKKPCLPDNRKRLNPFFRLLRVVAIREDGIGRYGVNLALQPHDAVPISFRCPRRRHNPVGKRRIANGPLKRLLRPHRKSHDRAQVYNLQLFRKQPVHRFDIVANRRYREPRPMKRFGRIARRGRIAISKQFRSHQE